MKIPYQVLLGLGLALAGCSGTSAVSPAPAVTSPANNIIGGDITKASYDAATDTLTISSLPFDNGIFAAKYTRNAALDTNGFKAYVNKNGKINYVALWGIGNNGTGTVNAGVVATGDFQGNGYNGTAYSSSGTTALPTSGIATYTGRYAGLLTKNTLAPLGRTSGNLTLDVDFTDSKVKGTITSHKNVTTATAMGDIALVVGSVTAGKFSGVTTSLPAPPAPVATTTTPTGIYQGIIGGPTGGEVAGIIILGSATTPTRETGAFVSDAMTVLPKP